MNLFRYNLLCLFKGWDNMRENILRAYLLVDTELDKRLADVVSNS